MEKQRFRRCIHGLALEKKEFQERCFFCLLILTINSLTSSFTRNLACCGNYVHDRCQKQWEAISNTCPLQTAADCGGTPGRAHRRIGRRCSQRATTPAGPRSVEAV